MKEWKRERETEQWRCTPCWRNIKKNARVASSEQYRQRLWIHTSALPPWCICSNLPSWKLASFAGKWASSEQELHRFVLKQPLTLSICRSGSLWAVLSGFIEARHEISKLMCAVGDMQYSTVCFRNNTFWTLPRWLRNDLLCRMGNPTLEITAGRFNNSTFSTLSGQVLLGWLKWDCENKNKHFFSNSTNPFPGKPSSVLGKKKKKANREAKMAKEHPGCFSARRGICYVAYSVDMLVGDVEKCGKCSVPMLSSGKYICRKKRFWTPHTFFMYCNARRISLEVQYWYRHPHSPKCCRCTAVSTVELHASASWRRSSTHFMSYYSETKTFECATDTPRLLKHTLKLTGKTAAYIAAASYIFLASAAAAAALGTRSYSEIKFPARQDLLCSVIHR